MIVEFLLASILLTNIIIIRMFYISFKEIEHQTLVNSKWLRQISENILLSKDVE